MSFLRVKPSIAGVVLTEFDRAFTNPYQGSRFDNGSHVDARAIARAAALVAATLHRLAGGKPRDLQVGLHPSAICPARDSLLRRLFVAAAQRAASLATVSCGSRDVSTAYAP